MADATPRIVSSERSFLRHRVFKAKSRSMVYSFPALFTFPVRIVLLAAFQALVAQIQPTQIGLQMQDRPLHHQPDGLIFRLARERREFADLLQVSLPLAVDHRLRIGLSGEPANHHLDEKFVPQLAWFLHRFFNQADSSFRPSAVSR